MIAPLQKVTQIYDIAASSRIRLHLVDDSRTEQCYKAVRSLEFAWRDVVKTDLKIADLLRSVKWLSYVAVCTPVPIGSSGLSQFKSARQLISDLQSASMAYPEHQVAAQRVADHFRSLADLEITEIGLAVCSLLDQPGISGVLTTRQWLNSIVSEHLKSLAGNNSFRVLRDADLRRAEVYERLILVGPPQWLSSPMRQAMRSAHREIVTLAGFGQQPPEATLLPSGWGGVSTVKVRVQVLHDGGDGQPSSVEPIDSMEPQDESFEINALVGLSAGSGVDPNSEANVPVGDAEIFRLGSGAYVFLPLEGRVYTIDLGESSYVVQQRHASDIQSGDYIALRTHRDRELIADIADTLLGSKAAPLRKMQDLWKKQLRSEIQKNGRGNVARILRIRGLGDLATPTNVSRWSAENFIRNQRKEHWDVLMTFLGLQKFSNSLWNDMGEINEAHREAGQQIRDAIRKQISELKLEDIRDGLELPPMAELGNERLTIFLIEENLGSVEAVRFTQMNKPIRV